MRVYCIWKLTRLFLPDLASPFLSFHGFAKSGQSADMCDAQIWRLPTKINAGGAVSDQQYLPSHCSFSKCMHMSMVWKAGAISRAGQNCCFHDSAPQNHIQWKLQAKTSILDWTTKHSCCHPQNSFPRNNPATTQDREVGNFRGWFSQKICSGSGSQRASSRDAG